MYDAALKLIYVLGKNVGKEKRLWEAGRPEPPSLLKSPQPHFPLLLNDPSLRKSKLIYSLAKSAESVECLLSDCPSSRELSMPAGLRNYLTR